MKSVWKYNQRVWREKEERDREREKGEAEQKWEREWEVRWVGEMEGRSEGGDSWKRRRGWDASSGKEIDDEESERERESEVHTAGRALTEAMWDRHWNNKSHDVTSWVGCERTHRQATYSHNNITSNSLVSTTGPNGDCQNVLPTLLTLFSSPIHLIQLSTFPKSTPFTHQGREYCGWLSVNPMKKS